MLLNRWLLNAVSRFSFPASLALIFFAALAGLSGGLPAPWIVLGAAVCALTTAWLLERMLPLVRLRPQPHESRTDWVFFGLTSVVDLITVSVLESFTWNASLSSLPLFVAVPLGLVCWELGAYVAHRLAHEVPWLWRFHALHHAPTRMVTVNNFRLHPVDLILKDVLAMSALLVLGLGTKAVTLVAVVRLVVVAFQHSNAALRHGPLNRIFSTNSAHRWHHSSNATEGHHNYGTVLLVWDLCFKTLHTAPDEETPRQLGLYAEDADSRYPTHEVVRPLLAPWCWRACTSIPRGNA